MTRILSRLMVIIAVVLAVVVGGRAMSAQDRYTLKVPNGLAFSEFKGYEGWQTIAVSLNGGLLAVILGNPAMIDAYKAGVPGNGKPFPDGAKMAKIHWNPKTNETAPGQPLQPNTLHDIDFMVKDGQTAAGERRQVRVRVPHGGEETGLRFHGIPQEVTLSLPASLHAQSGQTLRPVAT
jgi:Cytochrome P460